MTHGPVPAAPGCDAGANVPPARRRDHFLEEGWKVKDPLQGP